MRRSSHANVIVLLRPVARILLLLHYAMKKYTVCSIKSHAKIEITITATNITRIKYPLSSFNYHLFGANVANFNKIHCTVFEQQLFKNGTQKQLAVLMQYHQLQFVLKVVAICTDICMSLVQTVRCLLLQTL